MPRFLRFLICILSIGFTLDVFAGTEIAAKTTSQEMGGNIILGTGTGTKQETTEEKKDKEKTINDINTFLIESYKLKIDKILSNLNISLERVTNNDTVAQAKLLEKIRGDINTKIQVINTRNISGNRKIILSSVFSYIQENLDAQISKLIGQK